MLIKLELTSSPPSSLQSGVRHIVTGFFLGAGAAKAAEEADERPTNWQAMQHQNRYRVSATLPSLLFSSLHRPHLAPLRTHGMDVRRRTQRSKKLAVC